MKALLPLSWLYGAGVAVERGRQLTPKLPAGTLPRILSIGNLEAGGNGKTPLALWCLERLAKQGIPIAYVSRGYGARSVSSRVVTCVLPNDIIPPNLTGVRVLSHAHPDLAREIGDEGALVVERAPLAAAVFCADKPRGVAFAKETGAALVVLDDAFQSWRVPRHADVVLLDAGAPLDGGHLLPAGRLREAPEALRRADAVVFNGASNAAQVSAALEPVRRYLRDGVAVAGMTRSLTLVPARGGATPRPASALAVCAIARPEAFRQSLEMAGMRIVDVMSYPDHHRYTSADATRIVERAGRDNLPVVTTEKDWMKLRRLELPVEVWLARLDVSLFGDPLPL